MAADDDAIAERRGEKQKTDAAIPKPRGGGRRASLVPQRPKQPAIGGEPADIIQIDREADYLQHARRHGPSAARADLCRRRSVPALAPTASAVGRGVLHHPSHQLIESDARIRGKFGHERSLGHARLCIDLKTDQLSRSPIVVTKVRAAYAAAAKRVMGSQRKSADFLVNIW